MYSDDAVKNASQKRPWRTKVRLTIAILNCTFLPGPSYVFEAQFLNGKIALKQRSVNV